MSAKPRSLSWLCDHRHFIFKFLRLLVHQEQRKNAAGFSWVLVREGAAGGLGDWKRTRCEAPPHDSPSQGTSGEARTSGWKGWSWGHRPRRGPQVTALPRVTVTRTLGPEHWTSPRRRPVLTPRGARLPCDTLHVVFSFHHHNSLWAGTIGCAVYRGEKLAWGS